MTEFWVSQGNKWCDFCKIFTSNDPASIGNHELGQHHKDNVAQRLNTMREKKLAKEKEQKGAARAFEKIEAKAKRSYQKDMASFREARDSNLQAFVAQDGGEGTAIGFAGGWELESLSGHCYNQTNDCYCDPNSGFYYTEALGIGPISLFLEVNGCHKKRRLPQFEFLQGPFKRNLPLESHHCQRLDPSALDNKGVVTSQSAPPPGLVISTALNPTRTVKCAPSKLTVNKRKRQDEKPKVVICRGSSCT